MQHSGECQFPQRPEFLGTRSKTAPCSPDAAPSLVSGFGLIRTLALDAGHWAERTLLDFLLATVEG
jgi:hypothetical protein